jgi:hypothetical protein
MKYFEKAFPRTPQHVKDVFDLNELASCELESDCTFVLTMNDGKVSKLKARSKENGRQWLEAIIYVASGGSKAQLSAVTQQITAPTAAEGEGANVATPKEMTAKDTALRKHLFDALAKLNAKGVIKCIESGASGNWTNPYRNIGGTALMTACGTGFDLDMVKLLVEKGEITAPRAEASINQPRSKHSSAY